jgi:outer membrane protein
MDMPNVPTIVGVGIGVVPDYRGSDDYTIGIAPVFRYTIKGQERFIQLLANELSPNLLNFKMFRFGPLINLHFGRNDIVNIDDPLVSQMKIIEDTFEAGAFAEFVWTLSEDTRQRFILGGKILQDIGGESDGFRANINARYWHPVTRPLDLNISAGLTIQDDAYANHYFGVNANNVGTFGLPFFTANGGVNEYYVIFGGILHLS